ncbi:Chromosome partition protein Smc [Candidatus Magnetomoraceae bacterium gMMP-15]
MKLKELQLSGFKSFNDKTKISFPSGISAIVGPNGCGKSNIIDALKWVMGEQSSKQLRGKAMDDVIFAGTEALAPSKMAEVSLTLINNNGSCPEEYKHLPEITITRRFLRSGDRKYFINKKACRLKEIHNILMGSGMGARTYSIVQQGNVGAITEAGPEQRRIFIEEAAGITRYKSQKKEALGKMEATNQNLTRLKDIIKEVGSQLKGVKRQAEKAKNYQNYQNIIQKLDISLALNYYETHDRQIIKINDVLRNLKHKDIEQSSKLKKLNLAIEEIKRKRAKKNMQISELKTKKFNIQRKIDKTENNLNHAKNEIQRLVDEHRKLEITYKDQKKKNQHIDIEIESNEKENIHLNEKVHKIDKLLKDQEASSKDTKDELKNQNKILEDKKASLMEFLAQEARYKNIHKTASQNKESLENRLKKMTDQRAQARRQVTILEKKERSAGENLDLIKQKCKELKIEVKNLEHSLNKKSSALGEQLKIVQNLDLDRSKIKSRYSALKKMEDSCEWFKTGVRAVMEKKKDIPEILGLIVDFIEPHSHYEEALESALSECLQYVMVKDQNTCKKIIEYLKINNAGQCGFIPVTSLKNINNYDCLNKEKLLLNYISIKPEFEEVINVLLGNVMVTHDLNEAFELWNQNKGYAVVTQNGDKISKEGILTGGSKTEGIIVKKQEVRQLKEQLLKIEDEFKTKREQLKELESQVRDMEKKLQKIRMTYNTYQNNSTEAEKEQYRLTQDHKNAKRNLEFMSGEYERLACEKTDIKEEIFKYDKAVSEVRHEIVKAQEDISKTSKEISKVSNKAEEFQQKILDFKVQSTSLQAKLENSINTLRRLNTFKEDGIKQIDQKLKDIEQKKQSAALVKEKISKYEESLKIDHLDLKELTEKLAESEAESKAVSRSINQNDKSISEIQGQRESTLQKIRELELEQSQSQLKQENVYSKIKDSYDLDLSECLKNKDLYENEKSIEDMEKELADYRKKLVKLGSVNTDAIKEFEEHEKRYKFLTDEQADLLKAIRDLRKLILKIDRVIKNRFLDTFNKINDKLQEVFPELFNGGSANLILTDPDKPLETGVEFMVHPPGKRLTRLSLLSGGEKALSAIAFIFSIFLIKPTSFCVMDEIDAPLDEANVNRFTNLLKIIGKKSQIIMITHNKATMEFAEILFGVTMQQKGVSRIVSVNLEKSAEQNSSLN